MKRRQEQNADIGAAHNPHLDASSGQPSSSFFLAQRRVLWIRKSFSDFSALSAVISSRSFSTYLIFCLLFDADVSLRHPNGKPLSAKPLAEGAATYAHLMLSASSLWISDLASARLVTVTSAASASSAPLESSSTCSCSVWTCSSAEVRRAFSFSAASSACEPRDSDFGAD